MGKAQSTKSISIIYVTAPSLSEAKKLGRGVVQRGWVGCVNILPSMHSIYRWKGKVKNSKEVVLLLKCASVHYERVRKEIKRLHSYDNPCIMEIKVSRVQKEYRQWLLDG